MTTPIPRLVELPSPIPVLSAPLGAEPHATFACGDLVAGRFRVLSRIAAGGMGEVYEVEDLELGEYLALKTIRPMGSDDDMALRRFRREVLLARRVTHRNICRIFDLFHHGDPANGGVVFVTMELLAGETLAERLRRCSRLTVEQALPILRQVARGLAAAHELGIVHRDLKPGNIVLVPTLRGERVVITDFGLARLAAEERRNEPRHQALTLDGDLVGTPAYMAPEQITGGAITPAVDIYALGVLIYEMLTGHYPFEGRSGLEMVLRRLHQAPITPTAHGVGISPLWQKVILRCLESEPGLRFSSALHVTAVLEAASPEGQEASQARPVADSGSLATVEPEIPAQPASAAAEVAAPVPPAARLPLVSPRCVLIAAVLLLLVAGGVSWWLRPVPGAPIAAGLVKDRPSLALVGLENLSGRPESAWLGATLLELLRMELGAAQSLRLVSAEEVVTMQQDLDLPLAATLAPATLARVRDHLEVDYVLLGSYLATGEVGGSRLRLDLWLQETGSGRVVAATSMVVPESQLLELAAASGAQLRAALGPASETRMAARPSPATVRFLAPQ